MDAMSVPSYVIPEPSVGVFRARMYVPSPVSFDHYKAFQCLGLEVWGKPSEVTEMLEPSSSLLRQWGRPVLMLVEI